MPMPAYTLDDALGGQRDMSAVLEDIVEQIVALTGEIAELKRRLGNLIRLARVTEINGKDGTVKVAFALDDKGNDVVAGDLRWAMRAGSQKEWDPPAVGEQVVMISPGGDLSLLSWVMPGGFTQEKPKNDSRPGVYRRNLGDDSYLEQTSDATTIKAPKILFNPGGGSTPAPAPAPTVDPDTPVS
jgi:phage baseplate assembly protein V